MQLARELKRPPRDLATALVEALHANDSDDLLVRGEIAGPGFVNVWLQPRHVEAAVDAIRAAGLKYGHSQAADAKRINVEFVSANPTGPLTVGNARGAFVGDLLCRVLDAVGHDVTREYYFNDSGGQVERLGLSVWALAERPRSAGRRLPRRLRRRDRQATFPPRSGGAGESRRSRAGWIIGALGVRADPRRHRAQPGEPGHRTSTCGPAKARSTREGWVKRGIDALQGRGYMYEQDGALWFRSTEFGDDKDRVVIRSNGEPTYFAQRHRLRRREVRPRLRRAHLHLGRRPPRHGRAAQERRAGAGPRSRRGQCAAHRLGALRAQRRGSVHVQALGRVRHSRRAARRGGRRMPRAGSSRHARHHRHRLRHRARAQAVEREPGLSTSSTRTPGSARSCARPPTRGLAASTTLAGGLADDEIALGLAKDLLRLPEIVR